MDGKYSKDMDSSPRGILYPALIISGIAVTLFSLVGIARSVTSWIPPQANAQDNVSISQVVNTEINSLSVPYGQAQAEQRRQLLSQAQYRATQVSVCNSCGMVTAIQMTEMMAKPLAVMGSVTGDALDLGKGQEAAGTYGNKVEGKPRKTQLRYSVHVKLDDGGYQTFYLDAAPNYAKGQRVRIEHGYPVLFSRTVNA